MHANLLRLTLRTPLAATVLEVADQFLFLCVNRDNGLSIGPSLSHALADMTKLRIPFGIGAAFPGLAVGLQAELCSFNSSPTTVWLIWCPNPVSSRASRRRPLLVQRNGDICVAAFVRFNQREKVGQQAGISVDQRPVTAAGPANPTWSERFLGHEFLQATPYRACRDTRRAGNRGDAATTAGICLNRREQMSPPLAQMRGQPREPRANRCWINHRCTLRRDFTVENRPRSEGSIRFDYFLTKPEDRATLAKGTTMKVSSKDVRVREPPATRLAILEYPPRRSTIRQTSRSRIEYRREARYLRNPKYDKNHLEIGRLLLTSSQKRAFQQLSDPPAFARFSSP
jgi:hypothetical protein